MKNSGKGFLIFQLVLAFLLFAIGLYRFAPSGDAIAELIKFFTNGFIKAFALRASVALVYIVLQSWIIFEQALNVPLWKRDKRLSLFEQFKAPRNNSHAFIAVGIILSGLAFAGIATASTSDRYMFVVLTQGALGELLGNIFTMAFAFFTKTRSMDAFRTWVDEKDNDSWVAVIVAVKLAILALFLVVG